MITPLKCPKGAASLHITILDGHFSEEVRPPEPCLYPFTWQTRWSRQPSLCYSPLLGVVGGPAASCSPGLEGGKKKITDWVLDSLPPKIKAKGVKSKRYKQVVESSISLLTNIFFIIQEETLFLALALKTFNKSLNTALVDANKLTLLVTDLPEKIEEEKSANRK